MKKYIKYFQTIAIILIFITAIIFAVRYFKEQKEISETDHRDIIYEKISPGNSTLEINFDINKVNKTSHICTHIYQNTEKNKEAILKFLNSGDKITQYYKSCYVDTNNNYLILAAYFESDDLIKIFNETGITTPAKLHERLVTTKYRDSKAEDYSPISLYTTGYGNCQAYALLIDFWYCSFQPTTKTDLVVEFDSSKGKGHIYNRIMDDGVTYKLVDYTKGMYLQD